MYLLLPVVWVALEYVRAYVLSGFPWFYLAQTQYRQVRLIQIADLTGQYGVSFAVAMVNGALADILAGPLFARRRGGAAIRAAPSGRRGSWQSTFDTAPLRSPCRRLKVCRLAGGSPRSAPRQRYSNRVASG